MSGIRGRLISAWLLEHRDEAIETLMREQGGQCAACHSKAAKHLDHDHGTGLVRGMLCRACNLLEGKGHLASSTYHADPPAKGRWIYVQATGRIHLHEVGIITEHPVGRAIVERLLQEQA